MDSNPQSLSSLSLVNILTLRYDPTIKPNLPKKNFQDFRPTEQPNIKSIEKSICNNIERKLNSHDNQKVSIALSGGVDSTLVLSLVRKIKPDIDIEAFSIKFANSVDETKAASKIANKFDANHTIIDLDNYLSELPKAISMIKLPFWDLHWYYVAKESRTVSKFLISGDGGDELFGGYTFRYKKFLSLTNENSSPIEKVKAYLECHERDRVSDQQDIFATNSNFSWNLIYEQLTPYFDNDLSNLEQVFLADYNGKLLYNFNPVNTRIINHLEMNLLTPILNEELISSAPHIPIQYKYDVTSNIGKLPLRSILKNNGHDSLVSSEKLGFNVNTINLWNSHGHDLCHYFLDKARIIEDNWISKDWIQKYIDKPELDVKYINKFLGILAFEIWYRLFITKEISSEDTLD